MEQNELTGRCCLCLANISKIRGERDIKPKSNPPKQSITNQALHHHPDHPHFQTNPTTEPLKNPIMRPSTLLVSFLAAFATASPSSLAIRDTQQTTDAIRFAAVAADCSIFQCAAVIASAACIAASVGLGPAGVPGLLGCVAGGSASVSRPK
tara:strand:+ start:20715 stop:21170 length:456 start_codon:yes stop_codon:yes gene_type:complete